MRACFTLCKTAFPKIPHLDYGGRIILQHSGSLTMIRVLKPKDTCPCGKAHLFYSQDLVRYCLPNETELHNVRCAVTGEVYELPLVHVRWVDSMPSGASQVVQPASTFKIIDCKPG